MNKQLNFCFWLQVPYKYARRLFLFPQDTAENWIAPLQKEKVPHHDSYDFFNSFLGIIIIKEILIPYIRK